MEDAMRTTILLGLIFTVANPIWAADKAQPLNVKVGLWEVTTTATHSGEMPLPADLLAKLTPEQRAKMEQRMKANSSGSTKSTTRKSCMTKEKLDKGSAFDEDKQNCTRTIVTSSSSKLDMRVQCDEDGVKNDGTFLVEALSSESVKGTVHLTARGGDHTFNMASTFTAKWIGPVCGDVK
jgi:hypothetical protein